MTLEGYEADDFVSMGSLHFKHGLAIGLLATAIEEGGIWGWDRYGRFVLSPVGGRGALEALDCLARLYEYSEGAGDSGEDLDPGSDPIFFHGWRVKDLPDFTGTAGHLSAPKRRSDVIRVENGLRMQIGVLLKVILREGPWQNNQQFENQSRLIEALSERYEGTAGMSKRTLETSFARARKALTER